MNRVKSFFISFDFIISIVIGLVFYFFLPTYLSATFLIEYYKIIISTVAIIFSIMFAACSILMSSSDNDFITFLNEENDFDNLLWTFKITLISLFLCLVYSLLLFVTTTYYLDKLPEEDQLCQHIILFSSLTTIFSYSLISLI